MGQSVGCWARAVCRFSSIWIHRPFPSFAFMPRLLRLPSIHKLGPVQKGVVRRHARMYPATPIATRLQLLHDRHGHTLHLCCSSAPWSKSDLCKGLNGKPNKSGTCSEVRKRGIRTPSSTCSPGPRTEGEGRKLWGTYEGRTRNDVESYRESRQGRETPVHVIRASSDRAPCLCPHTGSGLAVVAPVSSHALSSADARVSLKPPTSMLHPHCSLVIDQDSTRSSPCHQDLL